MNYAPQEDEGDNNAAALCFGKVFDKDDTVFLMHEEVLVILQKQSNRPEDGNKQSNE